MKKLLNPRGYLSWTQIDMWHRTPTRYIQKYIMNQDVDLRNSGLEHGKKTSTALETGEYGDDDLMRAVGSLLPKYSLTEHEMRVTMESSYGKFDLLGKMDTFEARPLRFREYKTGRVKWTQYKAEKHRQVQHYATIIWAKYGKIPEAHLDWIQTEEVDGEVRFTGLIESYPIKIKLGDIIEYMSVATKAAREIDAEYRKHLKSLT